MVGILLVLLSLGGIAFAGHGRINVNTATYEELRMLPGISVELARNIIEYREVNGPFNTIDELINVRGMNETNLRELSRDLKLEGETDFELEEYEYAPGQEIQEKVPQ